MAKKDDVLLRMFEYLDDAKRILHEDGYLQPTVFAHSPLNDSVLVLPVVNEENDLPSVALDLVSKVMRAYDVSDYFVVSESYHADSEGNTLGECVNVIYVGGRGKKLISVTMRRLADGTLFFGDTVEIISTSIEGSVLELFLLRERTPKMTETEKAHVRLLFPAQSDSEIAGGSQTLH